MLPIQSVSSSLQNTARCCRYWHDIGPLILHGLSIFTAIWCRYLISLRLMALSPFLFPVSIYRSIYFSLLLLACQIDSLMCDLTVDIQFNTRLLLRVDDTSRDDAVDDFFLSPSTGYYLFFFHQQYNLSSSNDVSSSFVLLLLRF